MPDKCVVDTNVLQKANAPLNVPPRENRKFMRRLRLLEGIRSGQYLVMFSDQLVAEYQRQISEPRNDFVKAFFEILGQEGVSLKNWHKPWIAAQRERARACGFPAHDNHVLRTAIHPEGSRLFSEEAAILNSAACIKKEFVVAISDV